MRPKPRLVRQGYLPPIAVCSGGRRAVMLANGERVMTPVGYMAKRVAKRDWLRTDRVGDIYSVSGCISKFFCDFIHYWKHNGYWFFDSPRLIQEVAASAGMGLEGATFFYYECYELQYDAAQGRWVNFEPERAFPTRVEIPQKKCLYGYDVVSFYVQTTPECSPLSCNGLADQVPTNEHCLLASFDEAKRLVEGDEIKNCEPGPYRIFAVYGITEPGPAPRTAFSP